MSATEPSPPITNEKIAELVRTIKNAKPIDEWYLRVAQLFLCIASVCSITRWYNDWSYEEAPIWFHLGFWGGYAISIAFSAIVLVTTCMRSRKSRKALRELNVERLRMGLEPIPTKLDEKARTTEKDS